MKSVNPILSAICSCILFTCSLSAQGYFTREYSAPGFAQAAYHINCYDGGYLILNQYQNLTSQQEYICIIKTDSAGTIQWTKTIGPAYPSIQDVAQTTDSCYVLCYVEFSYPGYRIVKLDQQGSIIYTNLVNGITPFQVIARPQIRARNGGGYYIAGDLHNSATNRSRCQLMEFDSAGNLLWTHCYYETKSNSSPHVDFDTCSNGDIVLLGTHTDSMGNRGPLVIRIAPGGNVIWAYWWECLSFSLKVAASAIAPHPNGQITILSQTTNSQTARRETVVIQADQNGSELWALSIGAPIHVMGTSAYSVENSSTVAFYGHPKKGGPGVLFKIDTAGYILAGRKYSDHLYGMSLHTNDYMFSGINMTNGRVSQFTTNQSGIGCDDSALTITKTSVSFLKYTGIDDTVIPMAVGNATIPFPTPSIYKFNVCEGTSITEADPADVSIYPSPASDFLIINSAGRIDSYEILDVQGNVVHSKQCFSQNESVHVRDLANGAYFIRVFTAEQYFTKKFVIAR
jgi:hypothetical protein